MARAPIQTVFGNLVLARDAGDAWAVFRLRCRSYRSEPRRKQRALVDGLEGFCEAVKADFQILRVCRAWDAGEYVRGLQARTARRAHVSSGARIWTLSATSSTAWIAGRPRCSSACAWRRRRSISRAARHGCSSAARARCGARCANGFAHAARARLIRRGWRGSGSGRGSRRSGSCRALMREPARADEVQWLIRRAFCRGLGEPTIAGLDAPQALSYPDDAGR